MNKQKRPDQSCMVVQAESLYIRKKDTSVNELYVVILFLLAFIIILTTAPYYYAKKRIACNKVKILQNILEIILISMFL